MNCVRQLLEYMKILKVINLFISNDYIYFILFIFNIFFAPTRQVNVN